jgi:hypothetical protein
MKAEAGEKATEEIGENASFRAILPRRMGALTGPSPVIYVGVNGETIHRARRNSDPRFRWGYMKGLTSNY